jgi:hypothetical protein
MRWLRRLAFACLGLLAWLMPVATACAPLSGVPLALAQTQGLAVITTPLDGATVSGIVPILGTAAHPQFLRYELAFAYSPNPTGTWFTLQDPVKTPVVNEVLGRWDTTGISDGVYTLRLRVYWTDRSFLEAFARDVRVQNATPTPPAPLPNTPTAGAAATPLSGGQATATPVIVLPPTSTPRPTPPVAGANTTSRPGNPAPSWLDRQVIGRAVLTGLTLTGGLFALLGLYLGFKAALRYRPRR